MIPLALALTLATLAPSLVTAAIFPADTTVKMLTAKNWRKTMKANETAMVAFVAPWCGHCQRMAPEYSKAALGLYPLIPFYAVDCDANENKRLCSDQGVKGFPTVKVFPRGLSSKPSDFDYGERSASALFYFASRSIPKNSKKLTYAKDVKPWIDEKKDDINVLLLTKDKKVPMLWNVLANKYKDRIVFAHNIDKKGKASVSLGLEAGAKKESKLLVYAQGSTAPFRYEGIMKMDSISKFFDSVLDGTADLTTANEAAKAEEFTPSEEELDIQIKQEAQRMALAHGGYADMAEFEDAIKSGAGADYHSSHGYPGMMGADHAHKHMKQPPKAGADADKKAEGEKKPKAGKDEPHPATEPPAAKETRVSENADSLEHAQSGAQEVLAADDSADDAEHESACEKHTDEL